MRSGEVAPHGLDRRRKHRVGGHIDILFPGEGLGPENLERHQFFAQRNEINAAEFAALAGRHRRSRAHGVSHVHEIGLHAYHRQDVPCASAADPHHRDAGQPLGQQGTKRHVHIEHRAEACFTLHLDQIGAGLGKKAEIVGQVPVRILPTPALHHNVRERTARRHILRVDGVVRHDAAAFAGVRHFGEIPGVGRAGPGPEPEKPEVVRARIVHEAEVGVDGVATETVRGLPRALKREFPGREEFGLRARRRREV